MDKFFGRQRDIDDLNDVINRKKAHFILVYGRRRVGKTTLILQWAKQTGRPIIYWAAARDIPSQIRYEFTRALWAWAYPGVEAPRFDSWDAVLGLSARLIGDQPVIWIMDEFAYAAESDPSLPSYLQAAWDHHFKDRNITLVLAGSHIGMMVNLMKYDAPLYGRFTAQLQVDPLAFPALHDFLPSYSTEERVAVFAIAGGIPAYLEQFDDAENIGANIQRLFMQRASTFRNEPFILIGDVIRRETQTYEAILKAIASGRHTPDEIGAELEQPSSYLSPYLKQLESLHLIKRHIPATVPPEKRRISKTSRYHLVDSYLRFYFRFIAPNLGLVEQELSGLLWEHIKDQFRAFVGLTAFEELCREWTLAQARANKLPFPPEIVGSHWSKGVQVDVAALNWQDRAILLGECKWGTEAVDRAVIRELIDKAPLVVPSRAAGENWQVYYVFFARAGFTDAARAEAETVGAMLVDLERLDADLRDQNRADRG